MWDLDHNSFPVSLKSPFQKSNHLHSYSTRGEHYEKVTTKDHGLKSFKYQGVKIINELKGMVIYQFSIKKSAFLIK